MYDEHGQVSQEWVDAFNEAFVQPEVSDPGAVRAALEEFESVQRRIQNQAISDGVDILRVQAQMRLDCEDELAEQDRASMQFQR